MNAPNCEDSTKRTSKASEIKDRTDFALQAGSVSYSAEYADSCRNKLIIKQATGFGKDPALRSGDARRFEDSYKKAETATSPLFFLSPPRGKSFQLPALHNSRKVPGQCIS